MKTLLVLVLLATGCWAQTGISVKATRPKPDQFKTYEEYVEGLTEWKISQRTFAPAAARFQIVNPNPGIRADTFLIDTETGKVWIRTTITDVKGAPDVWLAQDKIDNDQEFAAWSSKQRPIAPIQASK